MSDIDYRRATPTRPGLFDMGSGLWQWCDGREGVWLLGPNGFGALIRTASDLPEGCPTMVASSVRGMLDHMEARA